MNLEIQIQSIVASISYGLFISLLFNLLHRWIICSNLFLRYLFNIIFSIIISTIYFIMLYIVNNGVISYYFLLSVIIGFFIGNRKTKKLRYLLINK